MKTNVIEFKDKRKKNRVRVSVKTNLGTKITYSSTEGYANKSEMITSAINSSIALLKKYAPEKLK